MVDQPEHDYTEQALEQWREARPDLDHEPMAAVMRTLRAASLINEARARVVRSNGLQNIGDYDVLALLRRTPGPALTPGDVAERLLITPSGMTGRLDRLEQAGLVVRAQDSRDRRSITIGLTDQGRLVADRIIEATLALYTQILADLDEAETEQLAALMERVLVGLGDTV